MSACTTQTYQHHLLSFLLLYVYSSCTSNALIHLCSLFQRCPKSDAHPVPGRSSPHAPSPKWRRNSSTPQRRLLAPLDPITVGLTVASINVNDPGLITLVNKLQDVFATVGVRCLHPRLYLGRNIKLTVISGPKPYRSSPNRRGRLTV